MPKSLVGSGHTGYGPNCQFIVKIASHVPNCQFCSKSPEIADNI